MMLFSLVCLTLSSICFADGRNRTDLYTNEGYSLERLVTLTKLLNYKIEQEGFAAYRAKENIQIQIGNLAPHVNLSTAFAALTFDYYTAASHFLGVLFPTNWYNLGEARQLKYAADLSYQVLAANQVNAVVNLVYDVRMYQTIVGIYQTELDKINKVVTDIKAAPTALDPYMVYKVERLKSQIESEKDQFEAIVNAMNIKVAQAVGIHSPMWESFKILPLNLTERLSDQHDLAFDDEEHVRGVQANAKELKTLFHLKKAARENIESRRWKFFHPDTGDEGSFGAGHGSYVNIGKANLRELISQTEETRSQLELAHRQATLANNDILRYYRGVLSSWWLSRDVRENLDESRKDGRIDLSKYIEELPQFVEDYISSFVNVTMARFRYEKNLQNIDRLFWKTPFYSELPVPQELSSNQSVWREFIIDQQEEGGFNIDEFELKGHNSSNSVLKFDDDDDMKIEFTDDGLMLNTDSFPFIESGRWRFNPRGGLILEFTFNYRNVRKNYTATGSIHKTAYGFFSTCNMVFKIYDAETGKYAGILRLTD